jgi:HEAT repeat protein
MRTVALVVSVLLLSAAGTGHAQTKDEGPRVQQALRSARDPSPFVRIRATYDLCMMGPAVADAETRSACIKVLSDSLADPEEMVRLNSTWGLGQFGAAARPAVPALVAALKDPEALVRSNVAEALGLIGDGDRKVAEALAAACGDTDWAVRRAAFGAAGALARGGAFRRGEVIAKGLTDPHEQVRASAARAAGSLGPEGATDEVVKGLLQAAKDHHVDVRRNALQALVTLRAPPRALAPVLAGALTDADEGVRGYAADALHGLGRVAPAEVVPPLTAALRSDDASARYYAALALGMIGPPAKAAAPDLIKALDDRVERVAARAAAALGAIGPEEGVVAALRAAAKGGPPLVRMRAEEALRLLETPAKRP